MFSLVFVILFFLPLIFLAIEKNWVYFSLYAIFYAVILIGYSI